MRDNDRHNMIIKSNRDNFSLFDPFLDYFFEPTYKKTEGFMKTDVKETDDSYELDIEVPGIKKENINLELSDGYLTITAHNKYENNESDKKENYLRKERFYGSYSRSYYVGELKEEDVEAKLDDGILHIIVPKNKSYEITKKKIEIK